MAATYANGVLSLTLPKTKATKVETVRGLRSSK
ncbi:MAG: hypothetical protein IPJ74_26510 [Saprospiraceae bacterium]|nr:hypothetical protein [Saprospiraceae bacterium]